MNDVEELSEYDTEECLDRVSIDFQMRAYGLAGGVCTCDRLVVLFAD